MALPWRGITRGIVEPAVRSPNVHGVRMGGGFTPNAAFFAGAKGFAYDFSAKSTLFQNSNGTGAVVADNDPIGYVTDLSGNGAHGIQATAASRPLYAAGSGSVYDGTKLLGIAAVDLSLTDKCTVVACVQFGTTANQGIWAHGGSAAGDANLIVNSATGGFLVGSLYGSTGNSQTVNNRSAAGAAFKVASLVLDLAGATALDEVKARINGELYGNQVQAAGPAGAGNFASRAVTIGSWSGLNLVGKILRIAVIGRALSVAELLSLEQWAGQAAGLGIISELPPAGLVGYSMLNSYGQSLSVGTNAGPAISTVRRFSQDYMFANGTEPWAPGPDYSALAALAEDDKLISGATAGESPISGMAEVLHERGFTGDTIGVVTGFPALTIAQLMSGQTQYVTHLNVVTAAWRRARDQFKHFKVRAFTWMQGESDGANNTYEANMVTLLGSLNTDIKAATLQSEDVWMITYQLGRAKIGLAHLSASDNQARIRVAFPMYPLPLVDGVHLTPTGSKLAGAYFGLAYKQLIVDGNTAWQPLKCTASSVAGSTLDLVFNPVGALAFDTSIVAAQTNQGFRLFQADGVTPVTINSVALLNSTTVRITAAAAIPAGAILRYGFSDPADHTQDAARGNLRDSQGDTIVFNGGGLNYPMHNWCVLFQRTVN